jgi:hypothetical protein
MIGGAFRQWFDAGPVKRFLKCLEEFPIACRRLRPPATERSPQKRQFG